MKLAIFLEAVTVWILLLCNGEEESSLLIQHPSKPTGVWWGPPLSLGLVTHLGAGGWPAQGLARGTLAEE